MSVLNVVRFARLALFIAASPNATQASDDHWSFQPRQPVKVPVESISPEGLDWAQGPLDVFVAVKLESAQIQPNPPAAPANLLRRLFLDLTGLPPEPEDVSEFLKNPSPAAYARWVDRLLESPAYGERWGRFWLDLARYADSNGSDENLHMANAYRYRDYVIRSFNEDKPYDLFLKEQIAGDLLPLPEGGLGKEELFDRWTALGFLALGPKVVAEQDKEKMIMDLVDEQMDVLGKSTLGLAIGCARCHDHKFDPITARDYYAMAGIFKSSRTMANRDHVSHWLERPLETPAEKERRESLTQQADAAEKRVQELENQLRESGSDSSTTEPGSAKDVTDLEAQLQSAQKELERLRNQIPPTPPTVMSVMDRNEIQDLKVHARGDHLNLIGDPVPRGAPKRFSEWETQSHVSDSSSGRLQFAEWLTHPDHPLTARVWVNRVWTHHFGQGLVRTPDNFGTTGDTPSHPELLDWLANQFVDSGWSTKELHRRILLSATYQMSADPRPEPMQVDPSNRLLWRMNPRRMEAEVLRDSILKISGRLDQQMQGTLITGIENYAYARANESFNKVFQTTRRSVYLPIIRSTVYNYLQIFDFCDPSASSGKRASTTVSHQALYLMNSDFIRENSEVLAEQVMKMPSLTRSDKLNEVYLKIYSRPATAKELDTGLQFLTSPDTDQKTNWVLLCQALFASNEFIYTY